jgi:hypothetical protein
MSSVAIEVQLASHRNLGEGIHEHRTNGCLLMQVSSPTIKNKKWSRKRAFHKETENSAEIQLPSGGTSGVAGIL